MHNLRLIRRRFPNSYSTIVSVLVLVMLSALVLGLGLLLLG